MNDVMIYLDIETTGFSRQWNEILEIAAIAVDPETNQEVSVFHEYIKPARKIPAEITQLTGITNAQVANCRSEQEVLLEFTEWMHILHPTHIIGHNCKSFDLPFITERCMKYGIDVNMRGAAVVDTLAIARNLNKMGLISTPNNKQPTLAQYFGVEYQAHSAIEDVRALIKINNIMGELINDQDVGF